MLKRVMIDLETMSLEPNAAIVQLAAVKFDLTGALNQFEMSVSLEDCMQKGLVVSPDTIQWWMMQPAKARAAILKNPRHLVKVLQHLTTYLRGADEVWCHATFDPAIIKSAYGACDMVCPVPYRNWRDLRTAVPDAPRGIHHTALADCLFQIGYLCKKLSQS